jgi:hypothetical protein
MKEETSHLHAGAVGATATPGYSRPVNGRNGDTLIGGGSNVAYLLKAKFVNPAETAVVTEQTCMQQ